MGLEFHFLRPWWLLLIILVFLNGRKHFSRSAWSRVIDPKLLPHLLKNQKSTAPKIISLLWPSFVIFLSVAMAGPTWEKIPEGQSFLKAPLIVALEVSEHMMAKDIGPNRLKRAIFKLEDLLKKYPGAEVSLVAFAGDAHIVVPLSDDHRTVLSLAKTLSPDVMPLKGVSAEGIVSAVKNIAKNNPEARLLLMSSTNFSSTDAKATLDTLNLPITLWQFATADGAPIGSQVSKLKQDVVNSFTNPEAVAFTPDSHDVDEVLASLESKFVTNDKKRFYDSWHDCGPYFLAVAMLIFLVAMFFMPEALWFCALLLFLPIKDAQAGLADWFLRKDQQAELLLKNGDAKKAAELFEDDLRKGSAYYKANDFGKAIEHLSKVKNANGQYNLGNAYAKSGQFEQAINAYAESLKLDPKNEDAKANKELVEKLQKEQKDKKEQEQKQDQKEQDKEQKQENEQDKKDQQEKEKEQKEEKDQKQAEKDKKEQEQKDQEKKAQKEKEQPKPSDEKPQSVKEEPKKLDKEDEYRLEKLGVEDSSYLRRKFLHETRKRAQKGVK